MKQFNQVKITRPRSNGFDLSHEKKLSCNMGRLVPILVQEVIPGDKFKVNTESLVRFAPMVAPVMHRINVYTHFFFVPNRLVYGEWEKFITGGEDGNQVPSFPKIDFTDSNRVDLLPGNLPDYMGLPSTEAATPMSVGLSVSALPFRAYQLIYNEYYRDQNLETALAITKNSTVSTEEKAVLITMRNRAWEKDYFTSALPWSQRGGEVGIPNNVQYKDQASTIGGTTNNDPLYQDVAGRITVGNGGPTVGIDNIEANEILVNDLRRAVRLQEWLEKNARAGSRYIEQILSHFGVRSSDARLQRPEYLGGGKSPVVISEVLSTFNNETVPGANMYGHGISVGNTHGFRKSFEEHGYIIGILSVLPRTAYQQGIDRSYTKFDKFDFYWPEFANLGEQEILNKELYFDYGDASGNNQKTFGYQSRYSEYKFKNSSVHGAFKNSLAFWHMGRIFDAPPVLDKPFIMSDPTHRIFADTDTLDHKLYIQLYNDIKAVRPMPIFGTPTL